MARPHKQLPKPNAIAGMRAYGLSWKQIQRILRGAGFEEVSRVTLWRVLKHETGVVKHPACGNAA